MKMPVWYRALNGKWVTLTHFPDGQIGLTMEEAMKQGVCAGYSMGMGHLDPTKIRFDSINDNRFLLREEK